MFFIFVALLQVIIIKGSDFNVLTNSDASASALQNSLISKQRVLSQFFCLSACNLITDCLTAAYNTIDSNCFLFKDQLGPSDNVLSLNSNLYLKRISKLRIK